MGHIQKKEVIEAGKTKGKRTWRGSRGTKDKRIGATVIVRYRNGAPDSEKMERTSSQCDCEWVYIESSWIEGLSIDK